MTCPPGYFRTSDGRCVREDSWSRELLTEYWRGFRAGVGVTLFLLLGVVGVMYFLGVF